MLQKHFFYLLIIFFIPSLTFSKTLNDTLVASQYYHTGDSLLTNWEFEPSISFFKKALFIYEKTCTWEKAAKCYNKISELKRHVNEYEKSISFAHKALKIDTKDFTKNKREDANAYDNIGSYYETYKSDFKTALHYYKKAFVIREREKYDTEIIISYLNIGKIKQIQGLYSQALKDFETALDISIQSFGKDHYSNATIYLEIGNNNLHNWKFDNALKYYQKAFDLRSQKFGEDNLKTLEAYDKIGIIHYQKRKNDIALQFFENTLALKLKKLGKNHSIVATTYSTIGDIYKEKGDYNKALIYQKKALEIKQKILGEYHFELSEIYFALGIIYYRTGIYDKALEFYYKDILTKKKVLGDNSLKLATTYNNIGLVLVLKNLYKKAESYFKKSSSIKERIYGENHIAIADSYNNLGLTYNKQENKEKALFYYKKSLNTHEQTYSKHELLRSNSLKEIGRIYLAERKSDSALYYFKKTLNIKVKLYGNDHPGTSTICNLIGNAYHNKKDYQNALYYYNKVLKIQGEISEKNDLIVASSYNLMANTYTKIKDYKKAQLYYEKAVNINIKKDQYNTNIFDPTKYSYPEILMDTFYNNAKMLQTFHSENQNASLLKQSIILYQNIDILINYIRNSYQNYLDKVSFSKKAKEIYGDAIKAQLSMYFETQEKRELKKAFYYSEKSKANTLKELLNDANAKNFGQLPNTLLDVEKNIKKDRAIYQSLLTNEKSKKTTDLTKIRQYENLLFDINQRQDSIILLFEKKSQKYQQLKYQNKVVSVSEIQQKLDKKTSLLEYFVIDNITYIFTISKNNITIKKLLIPELTDKIKRLQEAITIENNASYKDLAYTLYQKLIHPIASEIRGDQLIIIPDGSLWHLNFDLLLTQKENNTTKPKNLSYLLRNYVISYANSATLLFNPLNNYTKPSDVQNKCLAFSFSDTTKTFTTNTQSLTTLRNSGDDLPGTREEIKAIANIIDGQFYSGNQAIETNFKQQVSKYNILHLALHGEVDNENPENSRLYFTKTRDSIEDNLLYSHELFTLNIPAELAVLSACNTGAGKIAKGEGIMSLGNAFQYAGTKSLLLSSWEVSDKATPELMKYFYTNLKKGMNKAKALQQAKLQYLHTAEVFYTNPFYWGSFYLIGDTAPIDFQNKTYTIYWSIGLIIIGFLGLFFFIRNSDQN